MVIEGKVHGGLVEGFGMCMGQEIIYDDGGNGLGARLMDYFLATAVETPVWETDWTVTPSPLNPMGAKGIGEAGTIGSAPAIVNAVVDALSPFGVAHIDMMLRPEKLWQIMQGKRS